MSVGKSVGLIFICFFALLQLFRMEQTNPSVNPQNNLVVSGEVAKILKASCYDCHSNETVWPWYSHVAPFSWIVIKDVVDGRARLNFSEWNAYDDAKKQELKRHIYRSVYGAMPLETYTFAHKGTALNDAQKKLIREWTGVPQGDMLLR